MAQDLCQLFRILSLADEAQGAVAEVLKPLGLTQATFHVLHVLAQGEHSNKELADTSGCGPSNITRLVDRLVKDGLVARAPASDDRRRVVTTLTPAGQRACQQATEALQGTQRSLVERVQAVADEAPAG